MTTAESKLPASAQTTAMLNERVRPDMSPLLPSLRHARHRAMPPSVDRDERGSPRGPWLWLDAHQKRDARVPGRRCPGELAWRSRKVNAGDHTSPAMDHAGDDLGDVAFALRSQLPDPGTAQGPRPDGTGHASQRRVDDGLFRINGGSH